MSKYISGLILTSGVLINTGNQVVGFQNANTSTDTNINKGKILYIPTGISQDRDLILPKIDNIGIEKILIYQNTGDYDTVLVMNESDTINGGIFKILTGSDKMYYLYSESLTSWRCREI